MRNKGQTFMPDFVASMAVFGVLIVVFLSGWNSIAKDQYEFSAEREMRIDGRQTSTFLVSTPGYPEDWNSSNVQIPGFAEPDHLVQYSRLEEFDEIDYGRQKNLLEARNFYMAFRNETSVIDHDGEKLEYGRNYSDAETVVPFRRDVRLNLSGEIRTAEMRYVVWR